MPCIQVKLMLQYEVWGCFGFFFFFAGQGYYIRNFGLVLFTFFFNKDYVELQNPNVNPKFPTAVQRAIEKSAKHTTGIILISVSRQRLFSLPVRLDCPFVLQHLLFFQWTLTKIFYSWKRLHHQMKGLTLQNWMWRFKSYYAVQGLKPTSEGELREKLFSFCVYVRMCMCIWQHPQPVADGESFLTKNPEEGIAASKLAGTG